MENNDNANPGGGEAAAANPGAGGGESAAAAIAGAEAPTTGADGGESAAAAIAGTATKDAGGGEAAAANPGADVDLANTSDEDYAKLVQPDVEGEKVDRSLITPMAKELREAGIQPSVMAKVAGIYRKVVAAEVAKSEEARAERLKEMTAKCLAEVTDEEKQDFAAAYAEHIAKDPTLKHIVDHTELGSSPAFIKLIALAGATLRVERQPPAAAAAGSSQTDLDHAVFERTVPKDLR